MLKKMFLSGALLAFVFLAAGCGTMKGMAEGAKEDWNWLTKHTSNADDWVKSNLW
ncbi:MAG: hypothetical protein WC478_03985 [Candidatus Omnitrophota bacterium]